MHLRSLAWETWPPTHPAILLDSLACLKRCPAAIHWTNSRCSYTISSAINSVRTSPWNPYEAYICCPSNLACPSDVGSGLYTHFAVWCQTTTTLLTNVWSSLPGWPATVPSSLQLTTMTPVGGPSQELEVYGGAMYVIWESTDRAVFSLLKSMSPEVYGSINALAAWSTNVDPSSTTSSGHRPLITLQGQTQILQLVPHLVGFPKRRQSVSQSFFPSSSFSHS
ncbi:hypothetical protein BDZ45DRAFT_196536 [Acephala macrosclerotiorum]|nr:hypothetical protein BDZ45DRAFT_196536 [Acephala macrosclerotiorum]